MFQGDIVYLLTTNRKFIYKKMKTNKYIDEFNNEFPDIVKILLFYFSRMNITP